MTDPNPMYALERPGYTILVDDVFNERRDALEYHWIVALKRRQGLRRGVSTVSCLTAIRQAFTAVEQLQKESA